MMGSDCEHDATECEIHQAGIRAMIAKAAEIRERVRVSRGLVEDAGHLRESGCGRARTGRHPGMLQDDSRELSRWLAGRVDSMRHAREAAYHLPDVGNMVEHEGGID